MMYGVPHRANNQSASRVQHFATLDAQRETQNLTTLKQSENHRRSKLDHSLPKLDPGYIEPVAGTNSHTVNVQDTPYNLQPDAINTREIVQKSRRYQSNPVDNFGTYHSLISPLNQAVKEPLISNNQDKDN